MAAARDCVKFLCSAKASRKDKATINVNLTDLEHLAHNYGLSPDEIFHLVDIAASCRFGDRVSTRIIKSLIPASFVPEDAAVKALSWISTGSLKVRIQRLLLHWIVLIFNYLDGNENLHALYGMFFYYIHSDILLPDICQLLYFLTQKEDVTLFRIKEVITVQRKVGDESYLTGLLTLYKLLCPNILGIALPRHHKIFFPVSDRPWLAAIRKVREINKAYVETKQLHPDLAERLCTPKAKRRRVKLIPQIQATALEVAEFTHKMNILEKQSILFCQITSFEGLLENIDRLKYPMQVGAMLKSPLLQLMTTYKNDRVFAVRFSCWLYNVFCEEFLTSESSYYENSEEILQMLVDFMEVIQEGIPVVQPLVSQFFQTWNGSDFTFLLLKIITRFRLCAFDDLYSAILEPLQKIYFTSGLHFKCQLIFSLTNLLRNTVAVEWPRHLHSEILDQSREGRSQQESASQLQNHYCMFSEKVQVFEPSVEITKLIQFVDRLCLLGLLAEEDNVILMHFVLWFFEQASTLHEMHKVPLFCPPSLLLVNRLFFSDNPMVCSRICAIISNYRRIFDILKLDKSNYRLLISQTENLNICITDMCNCLWCHKAFKRTDKSHAFDFDHKVVPVLRLKNIHDSFSIVNHQAFLGYLLSFIQETQPGKVFPELTKEERGKFLAYLGKEHMHGIQNFISVFIKQPLKMSDNEDNLFEDN